MKTKLRRIKNDIEQRPVLEKNNMDIANVGLIFVPSKDGRSHCPEEWTNYEDLQKGVELAYYEVLKLCM